MYHLQGSLLIRISILSLHKLFLNIHLKLLLRSFFSLPLICILFTTNLNLRTSSLLQRPNISSHVCKSWQMLSLWVNMSCSCLKVTVASGPVADFVEKMCFPLSMHPFCLWVHKWSHCLCYSYAWFTLRHLCCETSSIVQNVDIAYVMSVSDVRPSTMQGKLYAGLLFPVCWRADFVAKSRWIENNILNKMLFYI